VDIREFEQRVAKCMKKEDRSDSEFRLAVATSQIGDLARYVIHDPKLNPNARKHGSPTEEKSSMGHAFIQLAGLAHSRGIPLEEALEAALKSWEDSDWRKRVARSDSVQGVTAHAGVAEGPVFLHSGGAQVSPPRGSILVTHYAGPDIAPLLENTVAVVSDEGGAYCHLAILARERQIPCIVGTGNATKKLEHGKAVRVHALPEGGRVEVLP